MCVQLKHIIFDFDGTLADTSPVILGTMRATIEALGLPPRTEEECRATIGIRLEDIPEVLWPDMADLSVEYASTYRRIFDEKKKEIKAITFPGVVKGLEDLYQQGYDLAVASSRTRQSVEEYLAYFGIENIFCKVVGGNDVQNGKPSPDPVFAVCNATGWDPEETLVIGDATYDIMMGKSAGSLTCAVTYRNQSESQLKTVKPTYIVDSFPQLVNLLS